MSNLSNRPVDTAWKVIPTFQSRDIEATVKFYTEGLGFTLGGLYNHDHSTGDVETAEEATFCSVFAGPKAAANIYFFKTKRESDFQPSGCMIALGTDELDELYSKVCANSAVRVVSPIADETWGYRQFTILDGDGNRLSFFRFLEGGNPGNDPGSD